MFKMRCCFGCCSVNQSRCRYPTDSNQIKSNHLLCMADRRIHTV